MPSVFALEQACPWQLKKGHKIKGCFMSQREAKRAAGSGWKASFNAPPGVPRSMGAADWPRAGQRLLTPSGKRWTREMHEEFAAEEIQSIGRELRYGTRGCSTDSVYRVARINRAIGRARSHLASIGPSTGRRSRVRKLWGLAGKAQKRVDTATNNLAKCLLDR
jgi:hypothetical protein